MESDMTEQIKGLQKVSLLMAEEFVRFCEKHGLLAYFCGGGCIGALRHKGFIPWDDDLDFFMPREDYEKFLTLWNREECSKRYRLSVPHDDYVDHNLFATIRDAETTQVKPYQKQLDIPHGVALDILPLDGYAPTKWKRKMQCIHALVYSLFCAQVIPEKHGGVMAFGSRVALALFRGKKIRSRIWNRAKKKMTKYPIATSEYITELCSGPFYMKRNTLQHGLHRRKWCRLNIRKCRFQSDMTDICGRRLAIIWNCHRKISKYRITIVCI